jgi:hypothetical protein
VETSVIRKGSTDVKESEDNLCTGCQVLTQYIRRFQGIFICKQQSKIKYM